MKMAKPIIAAAAFICVIMSGKTSAQFIKVSPKVSIFGAPSVTSPPETFFKIIEKRLSRSDRNGRDPAADQNEASGAAALNIAAEMKIYRDFYKKYIDVKGMPIVASAAVADLALQRTYDIVTHMLAGRPDIVKAMVDQGMYLIVIGKNQVYTDMPDYHNSPNPEFLNERVRGTGGFPTSFGEENLLSLPIDRYDDESIGVHEFCHAIDDTLSSLEPTWRGHLNAAFQNARKKRLFYNTYAGSDPGEYWAEIAKCYFDNNRINNWNHGPIGRRERLKAYAPVGYELCRTTFNLSPEQDWRYSWLQAQPSVIKPPARFNIDPYYTKFTWAREFIVIGREASDEALLHANETIRRMFAYRHDILKAFIANGMKLAVLGPKEHVSDLPEYKKISDSNRSIDVLGRYLAYSPQLKLLVVSEENVLANPNDMYVGANQVIRVFADAIYQETGARPEDSSFEKRPRGIWQQYELRVQRLDVRFGNKVKELYEKAMADNKWQGTGAVTDCAAYWTEGVLAYFDALGQDDTPVGASHPVNTREKLKEYDPALYALVNETMAYETQIDWRYQPYKR